MEQVDISKLYLLVEDFFKNDTTGHDWWHVIRVTKLALQIGQKEGANLGMVEPAALVHDCDDWKLSAGEGYPNTIHILSNAGYRQKQIDEIIEIVKQVSFKGAGVDTTPSCIEAMVVQDADRIDAIGAIGIARAFAYGGSKNRPMYLPEVKPQLHQSFNEYKSSKSHTINHFYEKLLLLKDRLNTPTAQRIAKERHDFMVNYLEQFFNEWNFEQ
ncbi:HD domain-containing protein [Tenuifilum thalassicum]|uniref:HD domain-containing protein n=1 Tax=Tenuifilum thalassicum TaxID=2590900 RepID=A0A7D3XHS8_9BACT|nr:HD domain-containing protein [Tenuifilum thalassicum]QKG80737.1 HD domain-containing protein [Tenuifilum thalassicum]